MSKEKKEFRTRVTGSARQLGKRFRIDTQSSQGKKRNLKSVVGDAAFRATRDLLERQTMSRAKEYNARGQTGWMVGFLYKDGTHEFIPCIAEDYQEALDKSAEKMNQSPLNVKEVVLIDPSLKEILKKVGRGARKIIKATPKWAGKALKKGTEITEKGILKGARVIGRTEALPREFREVREEAREQERPWRPDPKIKKRYFETKGKETDITTAPFQSPSPLHTSKSPLIRDEKPTAPEQWRCIAEEEAELPEEYRVRRRRKGDKVTIEIERAND